MKHLLTNDPLSLRMRPETKIINFKDLIIEEYEEDKIFLKKYVDFLAGKSNAYITRISLSKIKPGFYKRYNNQWVYIVDKINKIHVKAMIREIRIGNRPALHLYHNVNNECPYTFICSDDVVIYEAYKTLGIHKVPAILLGSKKDLEESAFVQKKFQDALNNDVYLIYSTININKILNSSLLGSNLNIRVIDGIMKIEEYFNTLKLSLQKFHLAGTFEIHYHEVLYSILLRIEEMLKSIRILLIEGLIFQATCILRSLYELSLNFYISWLSPYDMTQMLQISSALSELEWKRICEAQYQEQLSQASNQEFINTINKTKLYQYNFVNKVIEKARLSPLGEVFYSKVYTFLSDIVHHDFSMAARYKNALEYGDDIIYDSDIAASILRLTDLSASMVYTRIKDDIGNNKPCKK